MAKKEASEKKETVCPISRADFSEHAKPLPVKIGDQTLVASPREFSTGSFGFGENGTKIVLMINDVPVKCQVGITITVVGSKNTEVE